MIIFQIVFHFISSIKFAFPEYKLAKESEFLELSKYPWRLTCMKQGITVLHIPSSLAQKIFLFLLSSGSLCWKGLLQGFLIKTKP